VHMRTIYFLLVLHLLFGSGAILGEESLALKDVQSASVDVILSQNDTGYFIRNILYSKIYNDALFNRPVATYKYLIAHTVQLSPRLQNILAVKLINTKQFTNEETLRLFGILYNIRSEFVPALGESTLMYYYRSFPPQIDDDVIYQKMIECGWRLDRRIFNSICKRYKKETKEPSGSTRTGFKPGEKP
jgi:hypothetical protein